MESERPSVLTIAGFDPSGGAGVLADVKTFENVGVHGLAAITCNTIQSESSFKNCRWVNKEYLISQLQFLVGEYDFVSVKIGAMQSINLIDEVLDVILQHQQPFVVWDPVIKTSTGFQFLKKSTESDLVSILKKIDLITPNAQESMSLSVMENAEEGAKRMSEHCAVLLTGGHHQHQIGVDQLYVNRRKVQEFYPTKMAQSKHGSGCVLSAAIAAHHALEAESYQISIEDSGVIQSAKNYIESFLESSPTLTGYHSL